ncbi:uncharacterized protein [Haliotis cracherodii]|uniref:uncharacterized protein n=1 Tax=Haliotis cracherodii TaxID=6455 RepID=UPI0039EBA2D0
MEFKQKLRIVLFATILLVIVCLLTSQQNRTFLVLNKNWTKQIGKQVRHNDEHTHGQCPVSVLMDGHWKAHPRSPSEDTKADNMLGVQFLGFKDLLHFQRSNGQCGNVTHLQYQSIRALCHPKGPTPCCYQNTCTKKSVEEWVCPNCYDIRQQKLAEYSSCSVHSYTRGEICDILKGSTIHFVGDSLMRHMYYVLLQKLGVPLRDIFEPQAPKDECQFHGIFAERSCLHYVKSPRTVCDGNTLLSYTSYFYSQNGPQLYQDTLKMLQNPQTLLFTGIGYHVHFNHEWVCTQYIKPIAQLLQDKKSRWPKLLWLEVNAPGFVRAPKDYDKVVADVKVFNKKLDECLQSYKTPILKTYNMSSDLLSFDGVHYGFGFNSMKINLLLSFLREWRERGDW